MCRKKQLHGWCCVCFGLGILLGNAIESWLFCTLAGLGLIVFGFHLMRQK